MAFDYTSLSVPVVDIVHTFCNIDEVECTPRTATLSARVHLLSGGSELLSEAPLGGLQLSHLLLSSFCCAAHVCIRLPHRHQLHSTMIFHTCCDFIYCKPCMSKRLGAVRASLTWRYREGCTASAGTKIRA